MEYYVQTYDGAQATLSAVLLVPMPIRPADYYDAFIRELAEGKIKDYRPVEGRELMEEFTARLADLSPRDICRLFSSWLSSHELLKD